MDDEFIQYCELNKITDIEKLAKQTFNRGFTILKYGEFPNMIKVDIPKVEPKLEQVIIPKKTKDLYGE